MDLNLKVNRLERVVFDEQLIASQRRRLRRITKENQGLFSQGLETPVFLDRRAELTRRLKEISGGLSEFEEATNVIGRQRLLLSLYLELAHRQDERWLPPFDRAVANSVLGASGKRWHAGRQRQVVALYFTQFDRLPALNVLARRIVQSFSEPLLNQGPPLSTWRRNAPATFHPDAPQRLAKKYAAEATLEEVVERLCLPNEGRFLDCLRDAFLLEALRQHEFGTVSDAFGAIERSRDQTIAGGLRVGAAGLKVMVGRVATEGKGSWPGAWAEWITRFGCDPRHGRASGKGSLWWGWATDGEFRLAQQGMTGLTLKFFIDFLRQSLEGGSAAGQFRDRRRFLLALFEAGKIQRARLILHPGAYALLPRKHRDPVAVSILNGTTQETSMIALECVDDVYLIEGTHSFGLRMFHGVFPVRGFWGNPRPRYRDGEFRISPRHCPLFLRHDASGRWIPTFFRRLRNDYHLEWSDVRVLRDR